MKNVFKTLVLAAAAAVALTACQKELNTTDTPQEGDFIYSFAISNADNDNAVDTKSSLGNDGTNLFLTWENGDTFGAYATNGSTNSNNRPSTVAVSGSTYTLKVASTVELASGSTVYTYFPYNSGASSSKTAAVIKIDPVQTQKSTGFDASVMPMAGEVYTTTTTLAKDEETEVGEIRFANLGAIIEFNIYATSAIDEQIKSVQFNATSGNLAGDYTLDLTAVDFTDENTLKLGGSGSEASVKTNLETPVAIPVSNTTDKEGTKVYMSVAPGDYAGTIVVTTTGHTYTFTVSSAKTFNRSKVKRLNANLSTADPGELPVEEVWNVVTSASDFTAGTYVIVSSDKASYLVNSAVEKNPSSSTAHWDGSGKLTSVTSDAKWIATVSGNGLQFKSFANESNILSMSTSTAQGVAIGTSTTNSTFTLVANATLGGESGFLATTGNSRYLALYTNGTWRGYTINATSGYLNNSEDIKAAIFYKLADTRNDSGLAWDSATGLADITSSGVDYALPSLTNPNGVTVSSYSSSDETVATVAADGTVTALAEGTTTISAVFDGDASYKPATVSYELEVSDSRTACEAPTFNPAAGAVDANTTVTISTTTTGATIYYTTDESAAFSTETWTAGNTVTIDVAKTVRAVAVKTGYKNSTEASAKYTINGVSIPDPETITFADLSLENGVQYSDPFDGGNFTITFAGGGNDGKYYTTGSGIRTYGDGTITVASTHTISEIEFTWSGSSYAPSSDVASPTGYSSTTNKWTGSAKSVVLTRASGSGHWRLQAVKVTYSD